MKKLDDNTMQDDAGDVWVKQPKKGWPQVGENYFFVDNRGRKDLYEFKCDHVDKEIFAQGTAFRYEKNAQNLIDYRAAMVVLSKSEGARGFVEGVQNCFIDHSFENGVYINLSRSITQAIPIYFDTTEQAKAAIGLVGTEKLDRLLRWYHTERYFDKGES